MATEEKIAKVGDVTQTAFPRSIIPFTGGVIIFVYAFFWPEGYGRWLGTIVRGFRDVSGF